MKGILKLFPVALAVVALASCSNDDLLGKNGSAAVAGKTMEASIEDFSVQTRAAFAENKDDAGKADKRALVWTAGDSYKVYGELVTPDKYTLQSASAGMASGTFDLMTDDYNNNPAFAVFPYDKIEADRANSKLTVTLDDMTYATAEVKDAGYNQGGFVSNVPMYGKIGSDPKKAQFGYMTAILRVDLAKLPKQTSRLIIVTDRPLTGTFETEFDVDGDYPEIVSPVGNADEKQTVTIGGSPVTNYIMAVGTTPENKRTNKTFFIAVPTGNKYGVFDIYVEYNMAGSTQTELVGQLGNTYRSGAGKSVLNWQRGKVKSLAKEITVTSGANTPKGLAKFLADEWKTFPEGDEINITVDLGDGSANATKIVLDGTANDVFTVPAALKNKVINIIATEYAVSGTGKLQIVDEDKAPVASAALRKINFIVPTTAGGAVTIDAPETQVEFGVADPETETATYTSITATVSYGDMSADAPGLTVGEAVNVSSFVRVNDGSFLNAGTVNNVRHMSVYEAKFTGDANKVYNGDGTNGGDGDITVVEANVGDVEINGDGALTFTGKDDKSNTIGTITAKGAGAITVTNADVVQIAGNATQTGAITVDNVNTFATTSAITSEDHAAEINISNVSTSAKFGYKGKGKVTFDTVKGAGGTDMIVVNQTANTQPFTATNLDGTFQLINYNGTGAVDIEGIATGVTLSDDCAIKGGDVTLKNIIGSTGKTIAKSGTGALVIEECALQTVTNAGGTITASAASATAGRNSISALTQNGAADVTLTNMTDVTTLNINQNANVDYENTYIGTLVLAANKECTATGTKASGIGTATVNTGATFTPETDVWDGSVCPTQTTGNVYTSASLAALCGTSATTATLYLDLDMGGTLNFQDKATTPNKGIANAVATFAGNSHIISNLKAETGLFANRTAGLTASNLTIKDAVITATANAGTLVGIAGEALALTSINAENVTIASAATGKGTDINLGGLIGQVNANGKNILLKGCNVKTANIKGHYYMGGFIGQVVDADIVRIYGLGSTLADCIGDKKGSTVESITFQPVTATEGDWSTYKCGTIAPFIGGIAKITNELRIYGKYDSFDREANMWKKNFLSNEDFKFIGTKQDDCNFIGYIDVIGNTPAFTYHLKHVNGFQANPSMTIATTGDNGKSADAILATDCNVYSNNFYE